MKILVLGDVMGISGRKALRKNLSKIIDKNKIEFSVINGENAADDGKGITKNIAEEFFSQGIDVITSGNHIWDKAVLYIEKENRPETCKFNSRIPRRGFEFFPKIKDIKLE